MQSTDNERLSMLTDKQRANLDEGLRQSASGLVMPLGSFAEYAREEAPCPGCEAGEAHMCGSGGY